MSGDCGVVIVTDVIMMTIKPSFLRDSLFSRSSLLRVSVFSRAFKTSGLGYPLRIKVVVSMSAFKQKSSGLEHRRLILTNLCDVN